MSLTKHSILPAEEADVSTIAGLLHASKLQLSINRFVYADWPNEEFQRKQYTNAIETSVKDPLTSVLKMVDDSSGQILGYIVLSPRKPKDAQLPPSNEDSEDVEQGTPPGLNPEVIKTVMKSVNELNKANEGIDHIEITHICVRPSSRKHGIGAKLVHLAIEKAKAAGVPLVVYTEPAAHAFFLKQGFRDSKYAEFDLSQWAAPNSGWGVFRLSGMIMSG